MFSSAFFYQTDHCTERRWRKRDVDRLNEEEKKRAVQTSHRDTHSILYREAYSVPPPITYNIIQTSYMHVYIHIWKMYDIIYIYVYIYIVQRIYIMHT